MNESAITISKKTIKIAAIVIAIILVALISFACGMGVGMHKARFSYRWGENYERNFVGPRPRGPFGSFPGKMGRDFRNANGVAGQVISISKDKIIIKDTYGKENTVLVTNKTIIKKLDKDIKISEIKSQDHIVVLGSPSDKGVIKADLIRILDLTGKPKWR